MLTLIKKNWLKSLAKINSKLRIKLFIRKLIRDWIKLKIIKPAKKLKSKLITLNYKSHLSLSNNYKVIILETSLTQDYFHLLVPILCILRLLLLLLNITITYVNLEILITRLILNHNSIIWLHLALLLLLFPVTFQLLKLFIRLLIRHIFNYKIKLEVI